jgi:hypothetical protein
MDCSDFGVLYYGKPESLPEKYRLKTGSLEVTYESGCLRYISCNGKELVRNIYSAVRDRNWGTIIPEITDEIINENNDGFSIRYSAHYHNEEINFKAAYEILGKGNSIRFLFKGKALNSFLKNRIGICVLHPLEGVKNLLCKVTHPDQSATFISFPGQISPDSPVSNIVCMEWGNEMADCRLDFDGDVWEMEDHRNWTDSSYKTYCTPLSLPFPVEIKEGEEVNQKIIFTVNPKSADTRYSNSYKLIVPDETFTLPDIGTCLGNGKLSEYELNVLKETGLKHLRHDIKFKNETWIEMLDNAVVVSINTGIALELALHFSDKAKAEALLLQKFISWRKTIVRHLWFVWDKSRLTNKPLIEEVLEILKITFPDVKIGGGTDAYFAEFNRNRFDASALDFMTYAVCPQVHAFDNDSLVENMAAQTDTVESAKLLYPLKDIHISPVTLKQRFNVVATGEEPSVPQHQLPPQVDERQMSLFAAGWTLGSLMAITKANARAVTYFEANGWRGLFQGDEENVKPELFAGRKGDIYPVYHLLRFIHLLNPTRVKICNSTHPLKFSGLLINSVSGNWLIMANHSIDPLNVELGEIQPERCLELSIVNVCRAMRSSEFIQKEPWEEADSSLIILKPYAVLFMKLR